MQAAFQADSGVTPGKLLAANAAGVAVPSVGDAAHASAVELNNRGIFSSAEKGTITLARLPQLDRVLIEFHRDLGAEADVTPCFH